MTVFLVVLLSLLLFLLFLLYVNVHVTFVYDKKARVTLRVLFFRFDAMKLFQRLTKEKETEKQREPSKKKASEPGKETAQKRSLSGFLSFLLKLTKIIAIALREHLSKARFDLKELHLTIGTEDAARTALLYGTAVNAANGLCALLQRFSHFRCHPQHLVIAPDFASEKTNFSIHLDMSFKSVHLVAILIRAYFRLLEGKDVQHARDSVKTGH